MAERDDQGRLRNDPGTKRGNTTWRAAMALGRGAIRLRSDLPLVLLDGVLTAVSYFALSAFWFNGAIPDPSVERLRLFLLAAVSTHLLSAAGWGLYVQMWRHASIAEARRVLLAGGTSALVLLALTRISDFASMPVPVVVLGAATATLLTGAVRFESRLFAFKRNRARTPATGVVVIGTGAPAAALVREMLRNDDAGLCPVAIVGDDVRAHGRSIAGVPVVGGLDRLNELAKDDEVRHAVLAVPGAESDLVRRVAHAADAAGMALKVLPDVREMVGGAPSVRDVRDLRIEDLLGRTQIETDLAAVASLLHGQVVLITGAGGSIGSEIARQVGSFGPSCLVLLEHDETHLHDTAAVIRSQRHPDTSVVQSLVDIRDADVLRDAFQRHRPDIVFHAAAHKHVPLLEDHPCEAIRTNVLGTSNVVSAAAEAGVQRLVFISTDKAVEPSSVMGASKWLGEQIVLTGAPVGGVYCAVRFGNVLGSRGSVIPTFARQIASGGPVTVTDPRMTRFFMSPREAVQLVLQAAALASHREIFMLEMGEPVRIVDLAERMVRLSGRTVGSDVQIEVVGRRPGEKLHEELHTPDEGVHPTSHPAIVRLEPQLLDQQVVAAAVRRLRTLALERADQVAGAELLGLAGGREVPEIDLREPAVDVTDVEDDRRWTQSTT